MMTPQQSLQGSVSSIEPDERRQRLLHRVFGLRMRLLALVLLVIIPWLALVIYTQADERRVAIATANNNATHLIRLITTNQATQIEAARQLLMAFARLPPLRTANANECNAMLSEILRAHPLYVNFALADVSGNFVCSGLPMTTPINVADRPYFRRALDQRGFGVGDYQIGRVSGQPSLNFGYPVLDTIGNLTGIVIAAQSLQWFTLALENVELPEGAIVLVTDAKG